MKNLIVAFRATHNLSQEDLAELLGNSVTGSAISKYETGMLPATPHFQHKMNQLIDEFGIDENKVGIVKYHKRGISKKRKVKEVSERPASAHYHTGSIDVWAFGKENYERDQVLAYHALTAVKYIVRFGKKKGYNIEDLDKAIACINEIKDIFGEDE